MGAEGFKRKITAIMSSDVVGYSKLMGDDEAATVKTLESYKGVMSALIDQHRGRVIDSPGDNMLSEFASVVDAVQCAVAIQKELNSRNAELPENRKMRFRIGINLGDVIQEEDRIYGDGVNIAARLEALADPGGICVSKTAFDHVETKLLLGYEFLGEQEVKNIAKPVGAYRVVMEPRVTVAEIKGKKEAIAFWRRKAAVFGAIALLVIIIGVTVWQFYSRPTPIEPASVEKMAHPLPDKPSIAALPFDNLSGDPNQEYLSDGLTDEIIATLSRVPKIFVIARNSTFTYKGKPVKVQQVSEELGVRYVLEGSVKKAGNRMRITAQLIDAINGHHLWAKQYDRTLDDIFALQDEITKKIITAMQVKLTEGDRALTAAKDTENLEAYLKYLQANEYINQLNWESLTLARKLAECVACFSWCDIIGHIFS
jgi:TolB-like protein/class 3 adenylate cyclase